MAVSSRSKRSVQARLDRQLGVQGVKLEVIMMDVAGRGHRPTIAEVVPLGPRVLSLQRPRRGLRLGLLGNGLGQPGQIGGNLVNDPVDPGVFVGASGSSQISASSWVLAGKLDQASGGETSSPSPVCFFGIGWPSAKAELVILMVIGFFSFAFGAGCSAWQPAVPAQAISAEKTATYQNIAFARGGFIRKPPRFISL